MLAADVTNLKNRGLAFAFTSSPALISAFAGSKAAQDFIVDVKNWRWGYGIWAIIMPSFALPIYLMLAYNMHEAKKQGVLVGKKRTWSLNWGTVRWAIIEFDRK